MLPTDGAQWLVIAGAVLGVTSRTLIPFLRTLHDHPDTHFDRSFLVPAAVSVVLNLLVLPVVLGPGGVTATTFIGGYLSGWATQDMANEVWGFIKPA